jgi:benzoylformate decarboxylase
VLLLGGQAFMVYPFTDGSPLPDGCELVHVNADPAHLGRAHATTLAAIGDPGMTAAAIVARLEQAPVAGAADALAAAVAALPTRDAARVDTARARYGDAPMHAEAAVHAALAGLGPDGCIVDESVTTGTFIRRHARPADPSAYLFNRGGGLGWGIPAACGVALGHGGRRPVLCVVGDGSTMYSPQALWTAAREQLPLVTLVVDNGHYAILKGLLRGRKGPAAETGNYVAMDLGGVDHVGLARSLGVDAADCASADDVRERVAAAVASGRPTLLHVSINPPA